MATLSKRPCACLEQIQLDGEKAQEELEAQDGPVSGEQEAQEELELGELERCLLSVSSVYTESFWRRMEDWGAEEARRISAITKTPHTRVSPEDLAKRWRIGTGTAKQVLRTTTQMGIRHTTGPMTRRHKTDFLHAANAR